MNSQRNSPRPGSAELPSVSTTGGQIASGDADLPAAPAPLGEFIVRQRASWDGVNRLAARLARMGPQLEDQCLARAGGRLDDDVLAFPKRSHGLLLPEIGHSDLVERGKLGEL